MSYDEIYNKVIAVVKNFPKLSGRESLNPETHFANDLGLDDLDHIKLVISWEDEFEISIPDEFTGEMETPTGAARKIAKVIW